jgi:hypothetical protein
VGILHKLNIFLQQMILQYKGWTQVITWDVLLSGLGSVTNQKHRKRRRKRRECERKNYIYIYTRRYKTVGDRRWKNVKTSFNSGEGGRKSFYDNWLLSENCSLPEWSLSLSLSSEVTEWRQVSVSSVHFKHFIFEYLPSSPSYLLPFMWHDSVIVTSAMPQWTYMFPVELQIIVPFRQFVKTVL